MKVLPSGQGATKLGDYELVIELDSDVTTVFLARRTGPRRFSRWLAIRFVGPFLGDDASLGDQILADMRRASAVAHPGVLPIHEIGALGASRYVVSDYVEGGSLADLLAAAAACHEPVPVPVLVSIVVDALAGLHAVHEAKDEAGQPYHLVHGRLSPSNIVVGVDGRGRVADLGLSSVPRGDGERARRGARYAAPEVLAGSAIDARADVFAMGMVLHDGLAAHADVPLSLAEACERAIATDADARFSSAEAFSVTLERAAAGVAASASAREVAQLVELRLGPEIAARRNACSAWVEARAAWQGEPASKKASLRRRLGAAIRRSARRSPWRTTAVLAIGIIACGTVLGFALRAIAGH